MEKGHPYNAQLRPISKAYLKDLIQSLNLPLEAVAAFFNKKCQDRVLDEAFSVASLEESLKTGMMRVDQEINLGHIFNLTKIQYYQLLKARKINCEQCRGRGRLADQEDMVCERCQGLGYRELELYKNED